MRRFLKRLAALPTAEWLAAAEVFGAAREVNVMVPFALEPPGVLAGASASPWDTTRLQAVWRRLDELADTVRPLLQAQGERIGRTPADAPALMRDAAPAAVTAHVLGGRLSIYAWTLYAPFDPHIRRADLRAAR